MRPFQKSKIELLEELRELVQEARRWGSERSLISERRHNRKLLLLRREIDRWKKELVSEEKLKKQSAEYLEEQRKKTEAYYASDPSNRDQ